MDLIPYFEYPLRPGTSPGEALGSPGGGVPYVVCSVRETADHVPLVCQEPTLARRFGCEERVDALHFREVDALMRLNGCAPLTLDALFEGTRPAVPVILRFCGFRPDAAALYRISGDPTLGFGADGPRLLALAAGAYPEMETTGFCCRIGTAAEMAAQGVSRVCLCGRNMARYTEELLRPVRDVPLWIELARRDPMGLDEAIRRAEALGIGGLVLSLDRIR